MHSAIKIIAAVNTRRVIGRNGVVPWICPEDIAHFRRSTSGTAVIMGRKTWDSLPGRFRPLPNRFNVVVTRDVPALEPAVQALGGTTAVVGSIEAAIDCAQRACSAPFVIGGEEIYRLALPYATEVHITQIPDDSYFDGDAVFPELGPEWAFDRFAPLSDTIHVATYLRALNHAPARPT